MSYRIGQWARLLVGRPVLAGLLMACGPSWAGAQGESGGPPIVGPPAGFVLVAGGGELGSEIWERFVGLAGGDTARIVMIPTAATDEELERAIAISDQIRAAGAAEVTVLHTRNRNLAATSTFLRPLSEATGVWISGGRQHRLVEAYFQTPVQEGLVALLNRGGVVGGTSAGASILASSLVRGDPETNERVFSPEYPVGFGILAGTAVDQHLLARGRENDLWTILEQEPELLGIGLDEGTALVIQGDHAEVIGVSLVLIYDAAAATGADSLHVGDRFNLAERRPILPSVPGSQD